MSNQSGRPFVLTVPASIIDALERLKADGYVRLDPILHMVLRDSFQFPDPERPVILKLQKETSEELSKAVARLAEISGGEINLFGEEARSLASKFPKQFPLEEDYDPVQLEDLSLEAVEELIKLISERRDQRDQ